MGGGGGGRGGKLGRGRGQGDGSKLAGPRLDVCVIGNGG